MSYRFDVVVTDGKPAVDETTASGTIPDGRYIVAGHQNATDDMISVSAHRAVPRDD
jgi:hypothetical protein